METESRRLLIEGAKAFGIDLNETRVEAFELYLRELLKWNQKINLTAIRTEKEIVLKHFIDSLSVYPYLPTVSSLLDIGAGAGFPGIPLKMVQPALEITLIDSVRKKVDFQRHIIRTLGLKGIEAIHGRMQDEEILQRVGNRFDAAVARAFSDLKTLLPLALPFLKKGGMVLAMKGKLSEEEGLPVPAAESIGCRLLKTATFPLPFTSIKRTILLFEKI